MAQKSLTLKGFSVLILLLSFQLIPGRVAGSATFTVNTTNDTVDTAPGNGICSDSNGNCSLRAAIMEANALSGADIIYVPSGRYVLALDPVDGFDDSAAGGDLDITDDLSLIGAGAETTTIDGDNKYQVFDTRATVTISGVTISKGYVGCGDGGGIINRYGALTITDSIITGNNANQCGSTGGSGGGILNDGYYKSAQLTIINSTVSNNVARGSVPLGGGILSGKAGDGTVTLTIINSTITGNSAGDWGGGGHGGGISNRGGILEIRGSVISNNGAHRGGGVEIWQEGDTITITDTTISGNTAWNISGSYSGSGGGISARVNNLTITNSTISGNVSRWGAEGGHSAAGIHIHQGNVAITNSTVSGNNASRTDTGMAGGIINQGALTVINSTITNNSGSVGGIKQLGGMATLSNTIVANQAVGPNCSGTVTSNGYNLSSDTTCNLTAPGDIPSGAANLGPLADNGGRTLTHALLTGSQAINAGNNALCAEEPIQNLDQRGFVRWDAACDIGALEAVNLYALNITTEGPGKGVVTSDPGKIDCPNSCADQFGENTPVTLTATPDSESVFAGWSGDPDCSDGLVTMTADIICAATFNLKSRLILAITKAGTGSGTVTSDPAGIDCGNDCVQEYGENQMVTLTATPHGGSVFAGWSGDPDCSDGVVRLDTDKTCTATFNLIQHTLIVTRTGTGSGTVSAGPDCTLSWVGDTGTCTVDEGTLITLSGIPNLGSNFDGWAAGTGSASGCAGTGGCSFNLAVDSSISASFTAWDVALISPVQGTGFAACSYYDPPLFQWYADEVFRKIELQLSNDSSFASFLKAKGNPLLQELRLKANTWKKVLLLPGPGGGTVYWRIVGTRADKSRVESNVHALTIEAPWAVDSLSMEPTSVTNTGGLPTLSWENQCNIKFKVWFGNGPDFTQEGMKKKALAFKVSNPFDHGGFFTTELTSGKWQSIHKLAGSIPGATIYWYVESWDVAKRNQKTSVMSFTLSP